MYGLLNWSQFYLLSFFSSLFRSFVAVCLCVFVCANAHGAVYELCCCWLYIHFYFSSKRQMPSPLLFFLRVRVFYSMV